MFKFYCCTLFQKMSKGAKDSAKQKICADIADKFKKRMDLKSNVSSN